MANKPDYYDLLGVSRSATADEVKKAYRKKAFDFHPDRNPGDKAAEDTFKLVSEAYEVLSSPQQRQIYDQFGHAGLEGGRGGFHGFSSTEDIFSAFSDVFEDFFGFGTNRRSTAGRRAKRGRDIQTMTQVEFLEACFGVEKEVGLETRVTCSSCAGAGAKKGTSPVKCSYCNGYGQVQMNQGVFMISTTCPQCNGAGQVVKDKCPDCRGQGVVLKEKTLKVKVPAGVSDGMSLVLRGEGEAGQNGGPNGDLYVQVRVCGHDVFRREDDDIVSELKVPFPVLALGGELKAPSIDGEIEVEIKPGTQSGEVLRVKNKGVANLRSGRRGDQLLHVQAVTPTRLNSAQRELFEKLAQESAPDTGEEKKEKSKKKKGFFSMLAWC